MGYAPSTSSSSPRELGFVALTVTRGIKVPVEVDEDTVFHITSASLNCSKQRALESGTRAVLTLQSHSGDEQKPCPIAVFTVGGCETVKLDLRLSEFDDARFAIESSEQASIDIVGKLEELPSDQKPATKRCMRKRKHADRKLDDADRKLEDAGGEHQYKEKEHEEEEELELPAAPWTLPEMTPHDASSLSPEECMQIYRRDQLLWLRLPPEAQGKPFELAALRSLYGAHSQFVSSSWCVENQMDFDESQLTPQRVLGTNRLPSGPFYVSSILQGDPSAMECFYGMVPFQEPQALSGVVHDDGVWLFLGVNAKAKRQMETPPPIAGRTEHKDDVSHSGTWHMQLMGTKTWFVRPVLDTAQWQEAGSLEAPSLENSPCARLSADGERRISIQIQRGDVIFVNTRLWWHQTVIEAQQNPSGLSMSYARDFYLPGKEREREIAPKSNVDGVYALRSVPKGGVVLESSEIPDCDFHVSEDDPNVEFGQDENANEVLIALRDVVQGEILTMGIDEDGEYEEYDFDPATGQMVKVDAGT